MKTPNKKESMHTNVTKTPAPVKRPQSTTAATPPKAHHYLRTIVSSLFGFIALALIIVSIVVVWLDRTLTNTDQYVKTVAPLVTKPEVQDFVADKATDSLLDNKDVPIEDISKELLTKKQITGSTNEELKMLLSPILRHDLKVVLSSPAFVSAWEKNNRDIHSQLMTQLENKSPTLELNFHPLIVGAVDGFADTELSFVKDKLEIKEDAGQVSVEGKQLDTVHNVYDYFKKATVLIVVLAVAASALCVVISVHHQKTARRVALAVGIFSGFLALILSAPSLVKANEIDQIERNFALAIVDSITHDLRITLTVIAAACIAGSIGSKIYAVKFAKAKKQ